MSRQPASPFIFSKDTGNTALPSAALSQTTDIAAQAIRANTPLKVLHVHAGNIYGGVETMLLNLVKAGELCPSLLNSFALCFEGAFSKQLLAAGSDVYWLGAVRARQPLSIRRARQKLTKLLIEEAFDVVITHSSWSQAMFGPAVRAASVPLVFYMHGPANGTHWLERWARKTSPQKVFCNSRFTASTLRNLYPNIVPEVIHCPVASQFVPVRGEDRAQTRAELETSADATVIVQVSRLESWKGQEVHLDALGLLKDIPGWVCWQVGGPQRPGEAQYLSDLKKQAKRLGIADRVRFVGHREDVPKLLAAADIYCQPNTGAEPFGISLIEALYAQLPVVTTNIGGALEIVDESCGMLVEPGNVPALADALRRLIENKAERVKLGRGGPARAEALCDPRANLNGLYQSLQSIL